MQCNAIAARLDWEHVKIRAKSLRHPISASVCILIMFALWKESRFWQTSRVHQSRLFIFLMLVWFFGWGVLLLKFPRQCHRLLAWGKQPSPRNLKMAKMAGYMGLFFGTLLLIELAFGIVKAN